MDVYNKYNHKKNKLYDTISWINKSFREFIKNNSVETMKTMLICMSVIYLTYGYAYYINIVVKGVAPEFQHTWYGWLILFILGAEGALYINKQLFRLIYNDNILDIAYKNGAVIECLHELWYLLKDVWRFIDKLIYNVCHYYYSNKDDMYYRLKQYTKNKELSSKNHHGFDGFNDVDD